MKSKTLAYVSLGTIGLLFFVVGLFDTLEEGKQQAPSNRLPSMEDQSKSLERSQRLRESAKRLEKPNNTKILTCAQIQVKSQLKSPSLAKFPWIVADSAVQDLGNSVYFVQGLVDVQNSFGAMIRSEYKCSVVVSNIDDCSAECSVE